MSHAMRKTSWKDYSPRGDAEATAEITNDSFEYRAEAQWHACAVDRKAFKPLIQHRRDPSWFVERALPAGLMPNRAPPSLQRRQSRKPHSPSCDRTRRTHAAPMPRASTTRSGSSPSSRAQVR